MRNIALPIAFVVLMIANANANVNKELNKLKNPMTILPAEKMLSKHSQQMDSQFYANNAWLKSASYPSQKLTYYWNDTISDWELTLRNLFEYDDRKNILKNEIIDANGITNFIYTYEYTNDNKQLSVTLKSRFNNPTGTLQNLSREEISYNSQGFTTQRLIKKWDANTSAWIEDQRAVIEYDALGHNTEYRVDVMISGIWVTQFGYKAQVTYGSNNSITELKYLGWYPDVSNYDTTYKLVYAYSNNLNTSMEHHSFDRDLNQWYEEERTEIFYTADTATRILFYQRNGNNWELNSASDSLEWYVWTGDYNSSENIYKKYIAQVWVPDSNRMANVLRIENEFIDSNGSINIRLRQWENQWVLRNVHYIGYDSHKNLTENTAYTVDGTQLFIDFSALYTNTYDQDDHLISMVQELYDTRNLEYQKTTKFVFSNFVGIDKNAKAKTLEFYPNPSNGNVHIRHNFNTANADESILKIYSLDGRLVAEHVLSTASAQTEIKIEKAGMYVLKCGEYVGRIVIQF